MLQGRHTAVLIVDLSIYRVETAFIFKQRQFSFRSSHTRRVAARFSFAPPFPPLPPAPLVSRSNICNLLPFFFFLLHSFSKDRKLVLELRRIEENSDAFPPREGSVSPDGRRKRGKKRKRERQGRGEKKCDETKGGGSERVDHAIMGKFVGGMRLYIVINRHGGAEAHSRSQ